MGDVLFLLLAVGFFALSWLASSGSVSACRRSHATSLHRRRRRVAGSDGLPGPGAAQAGALLMTASGVFQLVLYVVVLLALAKPLGGYMARVYEGQPVGLERALGWLERLDLPPVRRPAQRGDGLEDVCRHHAPLQSRRPAGRLSAPAAPGAAAPQPAGPRRRLAGFLVQHRGELRHQHELAGLWRRDDHELSHPDARPHGPELRVGRDGHGHAGRVHPRLRASLGRDDRQLLGRPHPDHPVHPAAAVLRPRPDPGLPGRRPDLQRVRQGRRPPAH